MSIAGARETIEAPAWSVKWVTDRLSGVALHVAVIGLTIAWIVPTLGLFVSSFRHLTDISTTGWWTALSPPFSFTLENYSKVLSQGNLANSFINSFMITIPATIIPAALAAFAAYAFSWMKFPGRDIIFLALVGLLAVPLQLTFIPVLKMFNSVGLSGTFLGIWLAHTGYGLPFAIYLLANFFRSLPTDLFESAEMDGAGTLTIFFRIVLPLSVPAIASLVIFQFLWIWNDFLVALIYLGGTPDVAPMTVTVANLVNSLGSGYHLLTAAAFLSMIVPLIVFFSLQRFFVRGILAGSVKG
ncbi:MAG: carbohydrate ABC transporter permease [Candidatus Dormibacteraceae bacterium]